MKTPRAIRGRLLLDINGITLRQPRRHRFSSGPRDDNVLTKSIECFGPLSHVGAWALAPQQRGEAELTSRGFHEGKRAMDNCNYTTNESQPRMAIWDS